MPAKKGGTKKKSAGKKPEAKEEKVAPLISSADLIAPFYQAHHSAARWVMWVGVFSCAIIIMLLWGWSLRLQMGAISWKQSEENKLASQTKQNWDDTFTAEQAKQAPVYSVREKISALIAGRLNMPSAPATTTTSTEPVVSSTLATATSTPTTTKK